MLMDAGLFEALSDQIKPITKSGELEISSRNLTPLSQSGSAVLLEKFAAVEVAILIKVVVN